MGKLRHIAITAADPEATASFYEKTFENATCMDTRHWRYAERRCREPSGAALSERRDGGRRARL